MSAPVAATERVARPAPAHARPSVRRSCSCGGTPGPDGECAACKAKRLARERSPEVPPVGFGHDFGSVRVHSDAPAAASAPTPGRVRASRPDIVRRQL